MKRLAIYTALALATLAAVLLLWQFRIAIVLFILSLALSAILRPWVDFLAAHHLPHTLALILAYLFFILILGAVIFFVSGPAFAEIQKLSTDIPAAYKQVHSAWQNGTFFQRAIADSFPPTTTNLFKGLQGGQWKVFFQDFLNVTRSSLEVGSEFVIVFALSIYWSADEEHFKRLWLSLLPSGSRSRWRDVWQRIEKEIGAYLRSELLQGLLTLLLLWAGYQAMGIHYPVLLALFAAFSWLIVYFGGLVAVTLAFAVGLFTNPLTAVLAAVFTLAVLVFLEFIIQPRLFNRAWISSLLIIIMVLLMVKQFGLLGFLVAPPLAGVIQIFVTRMVLPATTGTVTLPPPPVLQLDALQQRLDKVGSDLEKHPDHTSPEITNLLQRLKDLIEQARQKDPYL